jgi:hypothetical protein
MDFSSLLSRASKFAIDNSPTILTTVGVIGAATTAYLAGKASFQAADMIRLKEGLDYRDEDDLREPREVVKDRVELVWRLYIPPAAMLVATTACIIGANRIGSRRAAAMAAAYSITEKTLVEYRDKVAEKFGTRKEEQVRDEIMQDRVNDSWDDSIEVHGRPTGEICYDKFSDRYVWSTVEGIRSAQNDLNATILNDGYAAVADFYYILDMPAPPWSQEIGWNADEMQKISFSSVLTPSGKPVIAFEFDAEPNRNFRRFH